MQGTQLAMSTAYHPQTDGQTERLNQCLENYLHCMTHEHPRQWLKWLSLVEYWYNTNYHTSLRITPFQALYGYQPTQFSLGPYLPTENATAKEEIGDRVRLTQLLRDNLLKAQGG